MFRFILLAVTLVISQNQLAWSQKTPEKLTPGDEMIYKYLCAETDKLSGKFMDGAKTIDEWKQKRPRLYQEYMDMLGLWPIPEKTPLRATITGTLEHEGVVINNLHFQSKPGLYVTANFYSPKVKPEGVKRLPTILYVCGHSNKGRDGNKSAYQDHGMWFASNGYNCLVLDTLQLGEIPGVHHGTYGRPWLHLKQYQASLPRERGEEGPRWWWHSLGYTPAGVEAWNGVRAIDYLLTRDDVDPDKIGVTGISGGGAATFWIAAADDRVKVAVPVSGMSDLESYVKNKVINGHCDCMFLYNTYQWEWTTIAAMIAPRPMLFANSDNDSIFPMDGNRRIIERLRAIYKMYGKPELVDEYVSKGGHAYRPDLRIAIFKFINQHLKGDTTSPVTDANFKPIEGKLLRVFPTDADVPKDAINSRIDETFVPKAKVELPKPGEFPAWKERLIGQLKSRVFRPLEFGVEHPLKWTVKSPPNYVERSHLLLGQTTDLAHIREIVAAFRKDDNESVGWKTKGTHGIVVAYAALFEPAIKQITITDPPTSHLQGPHFLNVLRVLDIPEALGLLAPNVKLTLVNARDPAFDRTEAIYRAAGAEKNFVRR